MAINLLGIANLVFENEIAPLRRRCFGRRHVAPVQCKRICLFEFPSAQKFDNIVILRDIEANEFVSVYDRTPVIIQYLCIDRQCMSICFILCRSS